MIFPQPNRQEQERKKWMPVSSLPTGDMPYPVYLILFQLFIDPTVYMLLRKGASALYCFPKKKKKKKIARDQLLCQLAIPTDGKNTNPCGNWQRSQLAI